MGDDITIGVTEIVNNIEVTAQPNDQIVDISVIDNTDEVTLNVTPTVIEINVNKGSSYAKWGTILGTLSDQEDLQDALDSKANLVDGKVPASELPSYVDDVIEVADYASLPTTGEIGKIYITLDNNKIYRWSGSIYIEIAANNAIWGAITGTLSNQLDLQAALDTKALKTITITPNAPLSGGGDLSSNRTLSITQANTTTDGYLSSTDWNTFNSKLSSLSGAVLTTTDQTVAGVKKFTDGLTSDKAYNQKIISGTFMPDAGYGNFFQNDRQITFVQFNSAATAVTQFSFIYPASNTNQFYYLPDASGTLALTSQLHNAVTIGTANGLSLSGQVLSLGLASSSANGALSSTDWTTFNNKLSSLSGAVLTTTNQNIGGYKTFTEGAVILNNSASNLIDFQISGESVGNILFNSAFTQFTSKASNGYLFKNTASENVLSITDSGIASFLNNVGIGTSSPAAKLDVSGGNIHSYYTYFGNGENYNIRLKNDLSGDNGYLAQLGGTTSLLNNAYYASSGQYKATSTTSSSISLESGNVIFNAQSGLTSGSNFSLTERMRITSGGNVGIGTTSPDNGKLTILKNTSNATESSYGIAIQSYINNAYTELLLGADDTVDCGVIQTAGKNTSFTTKKLALQPQGGNVGIGTTSPSNILTIKNNSAGTNGIDFQSYASSSMVGSIYYEQTNDTFNINNNSSYSLGGIVLKTNNTERMRITSGGNVGIGTTIPSTILHASDSNGAVLRLERKDNNVLSGDLLGGIETYRDDDDGAYIQTFIKSYADEFYGRHGYMVFGTNNLNNGDATERMRITSGGAVLINNTTTLDSAVKLQVTGSSSGVTSFSLNADDIIFEHNTNLGLTFATPNTALATISFADPEQVSAGYLRYSHADDFMSFATVATERMRITSGGNVGIGTTSPSEKLHVYGNTYIDGNIIGYTSGLSGYRTYTKAARFEISSYQSAGGSPYTKTMDIVSNADSGIASEMRFLTADSGANPSERMRIKSNGVVNMDAMPYYANNAAALSGGLTYGDLYYDDNATVKIVINLG